MSGTDISCVAVGQSPRHAAAGAEVDRLAAAAAAYADAHAASSTRRAYSSSWRAFVAWCGRHDAAWLPADALVVALYLTDLAQAGRRVSTISRQLAAINAAHRAAGLQAPASAELARIWSGIRNTHGAPARQKTALVTADLRKVVQRLPAGLAGQRDKAILLIGFAGALRRSELAPLELDDGKSVCGPQRLRFVAGGVEIRLDRSKTDQAGAGQVVAIPRGKTRLCPVAALRAWLDAAGIAAGPVFRQVDRHGRLGRAAITDRAVAELIKRAVARAGLDPAIFSGHSLRAGFVTSAAVARVPTELIMRQTRHTKAETVQRYVREADLFARNAAGKVGL